MEARVTREAIAQDLKLRRMRVLEPMGKCVRLEPEDGGPKILVKYCEVAFIDGEQYGPKQRAIPPTPKMAPVPIPKPAPKLSPVPAVRESAPEVAIGDALDNFRSFANMGEEIENELAVHQATLAQRRRGLLEEIEAMQSEVAGIESEHARISKRLELMRALRAVG
jgi:hypothetical protein